MKEEFSVKDGNGVHELIKSFEGSQLMKLDNLNKKELEIAPREIKHSSSSKAVELINKFIDVPEPEKEVLTSEAEKENVKPEEPIKEKEKPNLIDEEMKEVTKELEDLKKEEERCEKTYVTRETSTSSLEEAFVKRLQERHYKVSFL